MITYNPAFDLYHCIFRMANILYRLEEDEKMELDKVRIWDFYVLFPSKVYDITIRRSEDEIRKVRAAYVKRAHNPYEYKGDNRKLLEWIKTAGLNEDEETGANILEWIKPVQISALGCLVSCGILSKDEYEVGRICVASRQKLDEFVSQVGAFTPSERNVLAFLSFFSHNMSLTGFDGLKARTHLLESKYDAE